MYHFSEKHPKNCSHTPFKVDFTTVYIRLVLTAFLADDIEWPDNEDWAVQDEAKDLINALLQHSPRDRLGTGGAHEVKEHNYFNGLDWNSLLRQKAEFVPQLEHDEDTSYFDSKHSFIINIYLFCLSDTRFHCLLPPFTVAKVATAVSSNISINTFQLKTRNYPQDVHSLI